MKRVLILAFSVVLVACLASLTIYGLWLMGLSEAESALENGRYEEARDLLAELWYSREPLLLPASLVEANQARVALNLVQAGYALGDYEGALEFLQEEGRVPALLDASEYYFWLGNLLMARALSGSDSGLIETMGQSRDHYLEALRRASGDWDSKYNYEYVNSLLTQLQSGDSHSEEEMKLLLEKMRTDMPRQRKVLPPEKRK